MAPFTLIIELVGPEYRTLVGIGLNIPFALGEASVGVLAWLIPDWRLFQYITAIPIFVFCLIHFVIPESPRWLITKHKYKELNNVIRKMAKMNKEEIPTHLELPLAEAILNKPETKSSIFQFNKTSNIVKEETTSRHPKANPIIQLFSHSILRIITLVMFANWAIVVLGNQNEFTFT